MVCRKDLAGRRERESYAMCSLSHMSPLHTKVNRTDPRKIINKQKPVKWTKAASLPLRMSLSWALCHLAYSPPIYSSLVLPPEPQLFILPNPRLPGCGNRKRSSVNNLRSDILNQNLTHRIRCLKVILEVFFL